ncbi:leucyl aminopeptidase [Pontibacter sp. G13]|uniref:leucyl aminopeptidase family protein n=1 Tax=Pontibacter sp. G13 TaxID=3074898 RepID=UPI00288B3C77|nr:leucyl aminopeptidase [Pontibacter sp. G13]WNJ21261.1 leucyl aminopeptidase [Pontibacter sp. G13]
MKIRPITQLPAPESDLLVAVFVSIPHLVDAQTWIQDALGSHSLTEDEAKAGSSKLVVIDGRPVLIVGLGDSPTEEHFRKAVHQVYQSAGKMGFHQLALHGGWKFDEETRLMTLAETLYLSAYRFDRHLSKTKPAPIQTILLVTGESFEDDILDRALIYAESTCTARDLVNEPSNILSAEEFSKRIEASGAQYGYSVEVLHEARIQSLKMGGLLAVNAGSVQPPTFTIMDYRPEDAVNEKPIILVGKGVVYDTGGLSLKPTPNSMDFMKADMAGAAAVVGAIEGAARRKLPVWVMGLIPATDNRPGVEAFAPGDIITMYDGSTVEMLNSDAEGRMILADALSYAKQYDPELVIDLATLTGAAVVAIGGVGIAMMGTADRDTKESLMQSGQDVHERLVEFPLWEEYGDMLKSEIADIKNLGPRGAGAITAGKFLEHFTDYPWIHLDIAGASYSHSPDSYRGQFGTGIGVRLLLDYLEYYEQPQS